MPDEEPPQANEAVTRKMTASGGGLWEPPTVEEAAQLFPKYEVLVLLGRGGMGAVYQARQIELDRLVAIKLLPLEISADADFADRFRREARAMAKLNHPNIISVYDFGTTSVGHLFFVMEFVEGANLHAIIRAQELNADQALWLAGQVCTALAYAHGKGVVHRDIKPANVMVDTEGNAKVADFGLARLTDAGAENLGHTQTGTVMGTPDYMAPEQMRGMNVDHRADIYSVGVMLYEMLCREVPRGIFSPPSVRTGCDQRVDTIVVKAMQSEPEKRYQSTQEMQADMETARVPVQGGTRPPGALAAQPRAMAQPRAVAQSTAQSAAPKKSNTLLYIGIAAVVLAGAFMVFRGAKPKPADPAHVAAAPTSARKLAAAPVTKPEPWSDWLVEAREKTFFSDLFAEEGGRLRVRRSGGLSWEYSLNARDMAVRATWKPVDLPPLIPQVNARIADGRYYAARVADGKVHLSERRQSDGTTSTRTIQEWALPASFDAKAEHTLELRVEADLLTVRLNGQQIGSARDGALTKPGTGGAFTTEGTVIAKLEYLNLDATPRAPTVAEKWEDLIKAGGWPAPWSIENGVLTRPAKTLARRQWNETVLDGAWRVTRRWDGGWYDLQLGLRTSGQRGLRLHFDKASKPDVIRVLIGRDDGAKLGFAETKKRFQKGDVITVEFRAVGKQVTASIDGEVVVAAQDDTPNAGNRDIWTNYGDAPALHRVEFLNLDGAN